MIALHSNEKPTMTRKLSKSHTNKVMKRVFCLPALLGIFVLGLTQAQAGPVFFRPIAENIDIRTNVIGNNNVVVNNLPGMCSVLWGEVSIRQSQPLIHLMDSQPLPGLQTQPTILVETYQQPPFRVQEEQVRISSR